MGCACSKKKLDRKMYTVLLPGGTRIQKNGLPAATAFAAKHPGAKVIKPAA